MKKQEIKKIVVIVGPTAVGKTALSVHLAQKFNGEIVNGDSLQVYKGLDIGTAKVTEEEKAGIPHHLLDIMEMTEPFTASDFKIAAEQSIEEIIQRGKLPILVGGSGLYIEGLLNDMEFGRIGESPDYRRSLQKELKEKGRKDLWQRLEKIDPNAAAAIHPNNSRRVIRALESIHQSGKLFSEQSRSGFNIPFDAFLVGLDTERELLYERINQRVDQMVEAGLLREVELLYELSKKKPMQAQKGIGYKEWFPYLEGTVSFEEALEKVKQNSRRYAKRQLTWFRNRMKEIHWFDMQNPSTLTEIDEKVSVFLRNNKSS